MQTAGRVAVWVVLGACCGRAGAQILPGPKLKVGSGPEALATGDADGDGQLDLAVADFSSAEISVLLGTPTGFAAPLSLPAGMYMPAVALTDVNEDGLAEIVVALSADDAMRVFPSLGVGGFGPATAWATGRWPIDLAVLDVDGDGHADLLATNEHEQSLTLRHGDGRGDFATASSIPVPLAPADLEVADVDLDGSLDLVVATVHGTALLLGDSAGGFAPFVRVTPAIQGSIEIVDANRDGLPDFAELPSSSSVLGVWDGDGLGGFTQAEKMDLRGFNEGDSLLAVDLDGDSWRDLVTISWYSDLAYKTYAVRLVEIMNRHAGFDDLEVVHMGSVPGVVIAGDFDADGRNDLAFTEADHVTLLYGRVSGGLGVPDFADAPVDTKQLAAADLDLDGHLDVVALGAIFLGTGEGAPEWTGAGTAIPDGHDLQAGDVDGDGYPDIVVTGAPQSGSVVTLPGLHDGTLGAPLELLLADDTRAVALASFGADSKLDAVVATGSNVQLLVGQGDGHFAAGQAVGLVKKVVAVAAGDLDGDGLVDVVALRQSPQGHFVVLLGSGADGLSAPVTFAGNAGGLLALGDVDADGYLDAATALSSETGVVCLGDGSGGLLAPKSWPLGGEGVDGLLLADLDGDGFTDIVASSYWTNDISILRGTGNGSLAPARLYISGSAPGELVAGDFDEDGRLDVLVGGHYFSITGTGLWLLPSQFLDGPWTDVHHGTAGAQGVPMLGAAGSLEGHSAVSFDLDGAAPSAATTLVLGSRIAALPFKGGVLVPAPEIALAGLATDALGSLSIEGVLPDDVPSGFTLVLQAWIADASAPQGYAASNGLLGTTP